MKTKKIFLILSFVFAITLNAQIDSELELDKDDVFNEILPMSNLVDSAIKNSPLVNAQLIFISQKMVLVSSQKKMILRALTFNSQYSIGNNSASVNNQLLGLPYNTATATNFYSGGVFLNLSMYQIFARKTNINEAKMAHMIELENLEQIKQQIRLKVAMLYTNFMMKEKILKMRQDALSVSNMQYKYAEQAFVSNAIKVQEYSDIVEVNVKLKVAYEQAYTEYLQIMIELEEVTGTKIMQK